MNSFAVSFSYFLSVADGTEVKTVISGPFLDEIGNLPNLDRNRLDL